MLARKDVLSFPMLHGIRRNVTSRQHGLKDSHEPLYIGSIEKDVASNKILPDPQGMGKIADAWLEKSLPYGCISWDETLLKLLAVVLTSTLRPRGGTVYGLYSSISALCFNDIELILTPPSNNRAPSVQDLRGKITLKFRTATKYATNIHFLKV